MNSIEIVNLSLSMIGIPTINSFEDKSKIARMCKDFYPMLRDRVLREYPWSFATAGATLAQIDETPFDDSFQYVFSLPSDLIGILRVNSESFRKAGKKILANTNPCKILYTKRVEDPAEFDDLFIEALKYILAVEIGMAETRDAQLINYYRNEYEKRLAMAKAVDGQENIHTFQRGPRRSYWIESRFGGGCGDAPTSGNLNITTGDIGIQG